MDADAVRIDTIRYVHCTVVRAGGELDHAGRKRLIAHIEAVWDWSEGPVIVFDLADLLFYDSSVIGALGVALQRVQATQSGRIILARPGRRLLAVLRQTGLLCHVEIRDSVEEVVAELILADTPRLTAVDQDQEMR